MKAVMISIQPKWCELIASSKKTVEVRKTKPKLETPFKCYIYCTKDNTFAEKTLRGFDDNGKAIYYKANKGKVIGEFVCDRIGYVRNYGDAVDSYDCIASCLSAKEIIEYATDKNGNFVYTYGWHISDLVIYDKPRELWEFKRWVDRSKGQIYHEDMLYLQTPPQSWCYVEVQG